MNFFQSNEVNGSYHMEKEGLQRVVEFLKEKGFQVGVLATASRLIRDPSRHEALL